MLQIAHALYVSSSRKDPENLEKRIPKRSPTDTRPILAARTSKKKKKMKKEIRCQVVKNGIDFRAQSTSLLLVEFTKRLEGGGGASFPRLGSLIEVVSRGQEIPSTHRVRVFVGVGSKEGSAEEENEKGKRRKRKRKGEKKGKKEG